MNPWLWTSALRHIPQKLGQDSRCKQRFVMQINDGTWAFLKFEQLWKKSIFYLFSYLAPVMWNIYVKAYRQKTQKEQDRYFLKFLRQARQKAYAWQPLFWKRLYVEPDVLDKSVQFYILKASATTGNKPWKSKIVLWASMWSCPDPKDDKIWLPFWVSFNK